MRAGVDPCFTSARVLFVLLPCPLENQILTIVTYIFNNLALSPRADPETEGPIQSVLSEEGRAFLSGVRELDYMTHWVFRLFENKS